MTSDQPQVPTEDALLRLARLRMLIRDYPPDAAPMISLDTLRDIIDPEEPT